MDAKIDVVNITRKNKVEQYYIIHHLRELVHKEDTKTYWCSGCGRIDKTNVFVNCPTCNSPVCNNCTVDVKVDNSTIGQIQILVPTSNTKRVKLAGRICRSCH